MRVFPRWAEIDTLRPPLTDGERALVRFLDDNLPNTWRIYVQPYINDMRPDVVVVNPRVGLVVFEVKDWTLARYHFEHNQLIAQTATNRWVEEEPLRKSRWYAESLYEQFLVSDEAELEVGTPPNNLSLFRNAVYLHAATTAEAHALYSGRMNKLDILLGSDALSREHLDRIVPYHFMGRSKIIRDGQVDALEMAHHWLVPPEGASDQQRPLPELTSEQRRYGTPDRGFRRIRGVAGAGKSFVLAHRAAQANADGRRVLVLNFNITMSHALHDLLKRAQGIDWSRLTWSHFHGWAKTQAVHAGLDLGDSGGDSDEEYDRRLERALENIILGQGISSTYQMPKYGGIYIDEGQDFDQSWLDALAAFLDEDGELVLFADHRQNLYGKDGGRDVLSGVRRCRFHGPWAQLPRKSHRLPWRIAMFLNDYAASVAIGDDEDLPIEDYAERPIQDELALDVLAWRAVEGTSEAIEALEDALRALGNPHPNDVVVLIADHRLGLIAVDRVLPKFRQVVHVFGKDKQESRRRKVAFWMGRGGLKMCTIHSFKGWEINNVILIWPPEADLDWMSPAQRRSLFYTAISRGIRNLVVLNADRGYDRYFADWDLLPAQEAA